MKKVIYPVVLLGLSLSAFADTSVSTDIDTVSDSSVYLHNGLKVGLETGNTSITITLEGKNGSYDSANETYSQNAAFLGYEMVKAHGWGWSSLLRYSELNSSDSVNFTQTMIEGNATRGFGPVYISFGLNLSKLESEDSDFNKIVLDDIDSSVGTQFGFGYKPIDSLAIETKLNYTSGTSGEDGDDLRINISTVAFNVGVAGTF